jgi:hypothetical protein
LNNSPLSAAPHTARRPWRAPQLIVIESHETSGLGPGTAFTGTEAGAMFTGKLTAATEAYAGACFSMGPGPGGAS